MYTINSIDWECIINSPIVHVGLYVITVYKVVMDAGVHMWQKVIGIAVIVC